MLRTNAVVLGAGIAGLLAARVLADQFQQVTLVEPDEISGPSPERPGVPQSGQWHLCQPPTTAILEDLYPGLLLELEANGVFKLDHLSQLHLESAGHVLSRKGALPLPWYQPSRALLEEQLRARTLPRVTLRELSTATDLLITSGQVRGVIVATPTGPAELAADLVVDATGHGLAAPGLPVPEEARVEINVRQVTVTVQVPDPPASLLPLIVNAPHPARPYGVTVARIEANRWMLSGIGYGAHRPPTDRPDLLTFAQPMLTEPCHRMFETAPWPDPVVTEILANTWRRWDTVPDPIGGLLVIGDALCRINPNYGNGMTVAALQAMLLRACLAEGDHDLERRWFRGTSELIAQRWQAAEASDRLCSDASAHPEAVAEVNKMTRALLGLAENDAAIVRNMLLVDWGMAEPSSLFTPKVLAKLAGKRVRRGRG